MATTVFQELICQALLDDEIRSARADYRRQQYKYFLKLSEWQKDIKVTSKIRANKTYFEVHRLQTSNISRWLLGNCMRMTDGMIQAKIGWKQFKTHK